MTMASVLTTSNFSCPRCRDLTSNLMKNVDAFEVLLTRNASMPAEILISTIRQIVTRAGTTPTEETKTVQNFDDSNKQKDSQPQNQTNVNCSFDIDVNSVPAFTATRDFPKINNLDWDIDSPGNEHENLPNAPLESDSNSLLVNKTAKRARPGRPKRTQNNPVNSKARQNPRRFGRQPKAVICTNPALTEEDEAETGSQKPSFRRTRPTSNRPIATDEDFKRAAEYVKKYVVDTPDGLHYYLFECTQCSHQFPNLFGKRTAQCHIIGVHFKKRIVPKSRKTEVQLGPDKIKNSGRHTKVQLFGNRQKNRAGTTNLSNSRVITINSTKEKEMEITPGNTKMKTSRVKRRQSRNRSTPRSTSSSHPTSSSSASASLLISSPISYPIPIPPNLIVRNPCANFDLERTMNVRVCVELTPNLANIRTVPPGKAQSTAAMKEADDPWKQVIGLYSSSTGNQSGEKLNENDVNGTRSSQMLSDVLNDLVEMDVDSIMKMQL